VARHDLATRCQLVDVVAAKLASRQSLCLLQIDPVVRFLKNRRDDLLALAAALDQQPADVTHEYQVAPAKVRAVLLPGNGVPVAATAGMPFAEGPWCWLLEDVRPVEPFPYRGRKRLWDVPD
jgi:hypothetical protein